MCDCCDQPNIKYLGYNDNWHYVCCKCAKKYQWKYLEEFETGSVLLNRDEPTYLEDEI